jgi:hypothetical protein
MRHLKKCVLFLSLVVAAAIIAVILFRAPKRERQIRLHLNRLEQATYAAFPPRTRRDAFRWDRLKALLAQKLSPINDAASEMENQREELLKLGYFRKRCFTVARSNLVGQIYAAAIGTDFRDANWNYSTKGTNIFLTAAAFDMPQWEKVFSNLNARATSDR